VGVDQRFAGMKDALENATDEDRAAITDMMTDLNALLDAHARGEDTPEQFDEFMRKHGDYFPDNPTTIDELLDSLAQRAGAIELALEGLYLMRRISKESGGGEVIYG
jgi:uncharacterized protein with von Willebrand factor type A (vWA) domain